MADEEKNPNENNPAKLTIKQSNEAIAENANTSVPASDAASAEMSNIESKVSGKPDVEKTHSNADDAGERSELSEVELYRPAKVENQDAAVDGEEVQQVECEVVKHIPDDFYYELDEEIARPLITYESGLPHKLVSLYHSFGYDTHRRDNLHVLDRENICGIVGNYLEIINIITKEKIYVRSLSGLGIGGCAIHPLKTHIAIAERGIDPNTCIYEYPSLKLFRILRNGTQTAYAYAQFTPDGTLLATVGLEPDYLLTIWDWREENIILRYKAISQEIFRVFWSPELPGILTTAGAGHIKFWKMANTFTGLKLQGYIGKFGKVEISDIEGFVTLPDGKVLTGCEWGNMIVWEGDLIKVQICRKGKISCHSGLIMQIIMDEGELMTIGTDGYIRTWEFEVIDTAECSDEGAMFEVEPMNELKVDAGAKLMFIEKVVDGEKTYWLAQDANGAIWKLDLSFSHTSAAPERILSYHAGAIVDCDVSSSPELATTIGTDGSVRLYDLQQKILLGEKKFNAPGTVVIWPSKTVDKSMKTLAAGFEDGVVRILEFGQGSSKDENSEQTVSTFIDLVQVLKPHNKSINAMAFDENGAFFATSGDDATIFLFRVVERNLKPIGFFKIPTNAKKILWQHSAENTDEPPTLIIFTDDSCVFEVSVPNRDASPKGTFELFDVYPQRGFRMESVAGGLRLAQQIVARKEKYKEERRIRTEMLERDKEAGIVSDEDVWKANEEERKLNAKLNEEIAVMKPSVPDSPSPVLYGMLDVHNKNDVWFCLDGFDSGYLYKCTLSEIKPAPPKTEEEKAAEVEGQTFSGLHRLAERLIVVKPSVITHLVKSDESPLICWDFTKSGTRVILGFKDGSIRVQMLQTPFDFTVFGIYWIYAFQDNRTGCVHRVKLNSDDSFLLTVGADGTFFVTQLMTESLQQKEIIAARSKLPLKTGESVDLEDIIDVKANSIEEARQKAEYAKLVELGEEKKKDTRRKIADLRKRFKRLKEQNDKLPDHMRISINEYEILPRIRDDLLVDRANQLNILHKETAFESRRFELALNKLLNRFRSDIDCDQIILKSFGKEFIVESIRHNKLSENHTFLLEKLRKEAKDELAAEELKRRLAEESNREPEVKTISAATCEDEELEKHRIGGARGLRLDRQLQYMETARAKRNKRRQQWEALYAMRPAADYNDPVDVAAINEVQENMGDYKLKSAENYTVPAGLKINAQRSRLLLLEAITQIFARTTDFNERLLRLRNKKANIIKNLYTVDKELSELSESLPLKESLFRLKVEDLDNQEFPERAYDASSEKLKKYKQLIDPAEPAENHTKPPVKTPQVAATEAESDRGCEDKMYVMLENGRRILWLPISRLLLSDTKYSLHLPLEGRPDVTGLSVSSVDDSMAFPIDSVRLIRTRAKFQPESLVVNLAETRNEQMSTLISQAKADNVTANNSVPIETEEEQVAEETPAPQPPALELKHQSKESENLHDFTRQMKAVYHRNFLIAHAGRLVRGFDIELKALRHQKTHLDLMLKRAELNLLILYQEYKLLKEFEKSEQGLALTHEKYLTERRDVQLKVAEMNTSIEMTKKEIDKLAEKEEFLYDEFKIFAKDNTKFEEFLTKVFKKKIKRKLKKEHVDGEESSESESSSDDDSEWGDSDEEDDDELMDLDVCPPDCSQEDYDATIAYRERRLDNEDETLEQKRILDVQKKDADNLVKKLRSVEHNLDQAARELHAFQLEKQRKLNVLEIVVILRLNQIFFFQDKSLPVDFDQAILFKHQNISKLHRRIHDLDDEKKGQRRERQDAKAKHVMFQKHKKAFQKEIENMESTCDSMMIDKFGRIEDMEKMETIVINPKIEEITARVLALQADIQRAENAADDELRSARDCYIAAMRQNTKLLTEILMLFNELQATYAVLNNKQKNCAKDVPAGIVEDNVKLTALIQLVNAQADELNSLNCELNVLSHRAGQASFSIRNQNTTLPPISK